MIQALIVGGTTGMGKAIAQILLQQGIEVIIVGRAGKNLEISKNELSAFGKVKSKSVNLFDLEEVRNFSSLITTEMPNLKYLVNAAGYFSPKSFLEHTEEDYDIYHNFNKAFFFITQAVAKVMASNGGGSIVNIGSMWAKQAIKSTPSSAYSMAKAGLHSLTQHLAMELADKNIRVNAVSPAVVVTPIYGSFIEESKIEEYQNFEIPKRKKPNKTKISEILDWVNGGDFKFDQKSFWFDYQDALDTVKV
jgi:NAD(P)-dependent dehydrogenase (short-subunit alcohol dehydrogenase family)